MRDYVPRRTLKAVAAIFVALTVNFLLFRILPGDPVKILYHSPRFTPEMEARLSAMFGLDQPIYVQYVYFLLNTFQGKTAISFHYLEPAGNIVFERLGNTILLLGSATIISILLGVLIGVVAAWKRGTKTDVLSLGISIVLYSTPVFWLAMLLIAFFAIYLPIFPVSGGWTYGMEYSNVLELIGDRIAHAILPVLALTMVMLGQYVLIMRSSMIEVLSEEYITTARAKGLSEFAVLRKHALKNAMLPTTTLIALNLAWIVGGAIQTETVFAWPGLGRLIYEAVMYRDFPILETSFIVVTLSVILANLIADIIYFYLDPRIKY